MTHGNHELKIYTGERWISLAEAMATLTALRLCMDQLDLNDVGVVKIRCERTANAADRESARRREITERVSAPEVERLADVEDADDHGGGA